MEQGALLLSCDSLGALVGVRTAPGPEVRSAISSLQDVQDSHEEAAKVAPQALKLCKMVRAMPADTRRGHAFSSGMHVMCLPTFDRSE